MKKTLAILLALVMMLSMSAMAGTITVNKAENGQTYTAYKIFDVTTNGTSYSYTASAAMKTLLDGKVEDVTFTAIAGDSANFIVNMNNADATAKALAEYLNTIKGSLTAAAEGVVAANDTATIEVEDAGYYFVDSTLGSLCILNTAAASANVDEKNTPPTLKKEVEETTGSVGDVINFTITVTAGGKADTSYVVHDKMTGADLNADSFKIKVGEADVEEDNYKIKTTSITDDCTFEIEFDADYTADLEKGTEIVITYTATINANAVNQGVDNTATIKYGNSSSTDSTTETTVWDFDLKKVDGSDNELVGATFTLKDEDGALVNFTGSDTTYTVCAAGTAGATTTIAVGSAAIDGLAAGTYTLTETAAPAGYNMLATAITVTIGDDGTVSIGEDNEKVTLEDGVIKVENNAGSTLPTTGGMGTTLFYVVGGLMMAAAVIVLVAKKKVAAK